MTRYRIIPTALCVPVFAIDASANYNSHFYTHEAMATGFACTVGVAWNFRE